MKLISFILFFTAFASCLNCAQDVSKVYAKGKRSVQEKLLFQLSQAQCALENEAAKGFTIDRAGLARADAILQGRLFQSHTYIFDDCHAAVAETVGLRLSMEDDSLSIQVSFTRACVTYTAKIFAVFDGHAGAEIARRVKFELPVRLKRLLESENSAVTDEVITNALTQICVEMGEDFSRNVVAGTCACVVFAFNGFLYTANIGDSRAILVASDGTLIQLTEDAKPSNPRFKKTIIKERYGSGFVLADRIEGVATARDIGLQIIPGLIARPKITKVPAEGTLVIACDGLWDVASSKEVGKNLMMLYENDLEEKAQQLVKAAIGHNSFDNVSCLIVSFTKKGESNV